MNGTVEVDGRPLAYEILGSGEPVAFLNGVLMTMQSWVLQSSFFRHRYRCVMHDFRGQLLSAKPDEPWTMEDHADDFVALLDELGVERCHLVGTSYGGEVAMIVAVRRPERVASLSVISSASEIDTELDRKVASWAEAAVAEPGKLYDLVRRDSYSPAFAAANRDLLAQGEARLAACPPEFFAAFALLVEAFRRLDITAELDDVRCPTLVMVGEHDALKPPAFSRILAERIPGSELLLVPDAGHAVVIEKPNEVNTALLGFIEKHRMA